MMGASTRQDEYIESGGHGSARQGAAAPQGWRASLRRKSGPGSASSGRETPARQARANSGIPATSWGEEEKETKRKILRMGGNNNPLSDDIDTIEDTKEGVHQHHPIQDTLGLL